LRVHSQKDLLQPACHQFFVAGLAEEKDEGHALGLLVVEEGSLYPALQRMLIKGWLVAEWKQTENNRRARFYRLTPAGRKQLAAELAGFERVMGAIAKVIQPA
jgi:DNA-binding PadR family transcriptional regulator